MVAIRSSQFLLCATLFALLATSSACNPPTLIVGNAVVQPDGRTNIEGYVHRRPLFPFLQDVEGAKVEFFIKDKNLGSCTSDKKGTARMPAVIPADVDGKLEARTKLDGRTIYASADYYRWQPDRNIIAVDIDNTICFSEVRKILRMKRPTLRPIKDSKETLQDLAKDFEILYVTARPRRILERSRKWLDDHGYPPGPIVTSPGVFDNLHVVEMKRSNIMSLKKIWPRLLIGIGNKASDAKAYADCGMLAIIVRPEIEEEHGDYAIFMPTWYTVDQFFKLNIDVLKNEEDVKQVIYGKKMLNLRVVPTDERPMKVIKKKDDKK